MTISYDQNQLAAVEACFTQASRLLYCEPDVKDVAAQVRERLFASMPYGMDNGVARRGLALMDAWCVQAAGGSQVAGDPQAADAAGPFGERVAALKREWFRLFVGAGAPDAPCWESFYVEPNSQLFGTCTLDVRAAYRRHGLQIERLHSEPDDHLGLMLGFLAHLAGAEADALAVGDQDAARAACAEQEEFLAGHVLPWLAVWRYAVDKHATSDYFRGASELVFGLCACYASRFGIAFDEEQRVFKRASTPAEVA